MKTKSSQHFYIKERHNPQLGVYYSPLGQLSKAKAKRHEVSLYGTNYVHAFETEADYTAEVNRLKQAGEDVR